MTAFGTPDDYFAWAKSIYGDILAAFARHGVYPDPELKFIKGDMPNPYYEAHTKTIAIGMPDPTILTERFYWLAAAKMLGLASVDEAIQATKVQLPFVVAHELVHHLRHHYHAPVGNDFLEEQVANLVAVALIREHPKYAPTLSELRALAERAHEKLETLSAETTPYLAGFHLDTRSVLAAQGRLEDEKLDALRLLSDVLGEDPDQFLTASLSAEDLQEARQRQEETEAYFNARYGQALFEYTFFFNTWFRAYLDRDDLPKFGEALEEHILTDDWERALRQESLELLATTLHHPQDDLAVSAAEALALEAGAAAVAELLTALMQRRPAVQAAILRVLLPFVTEAGVLEAAVRCIALPEVTVRARAAALLLKDGRATGEKLLERLFRGDSTAQRAVLLAVAPLGDGRFKEVFLGALESPSDALQIAALEGLAAFPPDETIGRAVARALEAEDDRVRLAAVPVLQKHIGADTLPALAGALEDASARVRGRALEALRALGTGARPALEGARTSVRAQTKALLLRHTLEPCETLVQDLIRRLLAWAEACGEDCDNPYEDARLERLLRDALREERSKLCLLALRLAGVLGKAEALERTLPALSSPDPRVRQAARKVYERALPSDLWGQIAGLLDTGGKRGLAKLEDYPEGHLRDMMRFVTPADDSPMPVMTTVEKLMFLRGVPLFRGVTLEDLRPLSEAFIMRHYQKGETIFALGHPADALYIITAGTVHIEQNNPDGSLYHYKDLTAGQHFGEAALFEEVPRTAAATALEPTSVLTLSRAPFVRLGERQPQLLFEIIRSLSQRLRAVNADFG